MTTTNATFAGAVPRIYHEHLGPMLFVPYARDLARRLPMRPGARILELACGSGILTAEIMPMLVDAAAICATDLNDAMIEVAKSHVRSDRVRWETADATTLKFDADSFDVVVSQFGFMFFPDKIAAAREARRVLRGHGTLLFNVWATLEENPVSHLAHDTISSFFAADPPTFYRVPFGYADRARIAADLDAAGFADITIDTVDVVGRSPSAEHAAIGLVQGTPVVHAIRERNTVPVEEVTRAVARAIDREFGPGEIRAPMRAHVVTARP